MADAALNTARRSPRGALRLWLPLAWIALVLFVAIFAPWIAPHDPLAQDLMLERLPPFFLSGAEQGFWLGTDSLGRDVLSRMLYGARIALFVSVVAATTTAMFGAALGLLAGYFGGWWIG